MKLITDDDAVDQAVRAICDLILHQFDNAREFVPAVEWAAYEIIDNILVHAETPAPGAMCAQYFPQRHRLDFAICDVGRGIKSTLGETRALSSHAEAIRVALERGVTRSQEVGQGNGMAGALEIVRQNRGHMRIWTGDALFRFADGVERGIDIIPLTPGTGVVFSLTPVARSICRAPGSRPATAGPSSTPRPSASVRAEFESLRSAATLGPARPPSAYGER